MSIPMIAGLYPYTRGGVAQTPRITEADLAVARRVVETTLAGREVPLRMKDNLVATVCGLVHLEGYASSLGVRLPELDVGALVAAQCDDLLESGGHTVKTGLDYFVEILSSLAVSGAIRDGRQCTYAGGHLALHIASCHADYAEHARRAGYEGEVLDKKALVRQLQENQRRGGFVVDVSRPVSFGSRADKRRAAILDLNAAKRLLDVDDFPQGELQQEVPEVVLGGRLVEGALLAARRLGVPRLQADRVDQPDAGLHLAGVQGRLEPAELDRVAVRRRCAG